MKIMKIEQTHIEQIKTAFQNMQSKEDLLQLLIKRRQDYLEVRSLIQEKLNHKTI